MTVVAFANRTITVANGYTAQAVFYANGKITGTPSGIPGTEKWWDTAPDSSNPGINYWVRFTPKTGPWGALWGNNLYCIESGGSGATAWTQVNGADSCTIQMNPPPGAAHKVGTVLVELASDSAGVNLVASATYTFDINKNG